MKTDGPKITRIEAFSDGVIAIIITIMVLELKIPDNGGGLGHGLIVQLMPVLMPYMLSFLMIGIMWVNHYHLLHSARHVDYKLVWCNIHLLFWMSLIPVTTAYMDDYLFNPVAIANYGFVLAGCFIAFSLLRSSVTRDEHGQMSPRAAAELKKSRIVAAIYAASIPLAFVSVYVSMVIFVAIPAIYFLPDFLLPRSLNLRPEWE